MSDIPTDWRATLRAGDIVAFTFPSTEQEPLLEKRRPCLVLQVTDTGPDSEVLLAYGTAARTRANAGLEIRVMQKDDIRACSLDKPTRFVGARTVRVTLDSSRFVQGLFGTPVIGCLPASLEARLARVLEVDEGPRRGQRRRRRATCIDLRDEAAPTGGPATPLSVDCAAGTVARR